MDHNDIHHKLSDYLDGAVTGTERTAIEEHLKTCAVCGNALIELRKTIEAVRQVEEVEPPAWMTQKIMARVRAETGRKKTVFQRLFHPLAIKVPLQTVAVLFLAVTAFYIYRSIQPEMKFTETPAPVFEAKKELPAPGRAKGAAPEVEGTAPKQTAQQEPGYRSLDMKYAYEKPAPPALKEQAAEPPPAAASPAPEKPSRALDEAGMKKYKAAKAPVDESMKDTLKPEEAPAPVVKQGEAGRSMGSLAREEQQTAASAVQLNTEKHQPACLSYEPAVVFLAGIIQQKDFPGPPDYTSIARGDKRETSWILRLEKPVCVAGKSGNVADVAETNVSEIQLVMDPAGYAKYRGLLTGPVTVRGTLFHAHTGHHRTRVLLTVLDISEKR